jgi:F-type H+-transporting ATPase subunit gamma
MANTITLKRRINSVKNTKQITKAMELVAASKMKKAQEFAQQSRDYRRYAHSLLSRMNQITEVEDHPLFKKRDVKRRLYIVLSSNRGLAGAYNANIMRLLAKQIIDDTSKSIKPSVIAIGKQAAQFTRRLEGVELVAAYPMFGDQPTANDIRPILNTIVELYSTEKVDNVQLIYTDLKSNILQVATCLSLLPAAFSGV